MADTCPRCDQPIAASTTATKASIDHDEAQQARTCMVLEGNEIGIYYHRREDLEADAVDDATPDTKDPMDLTGDHARVYNIVLEETVNGGSIREAELGGKAVDAGIPPDELKKIARELADDGFLESPTDAVYRVPEGVSA